MIQPKIFISYARDDDEPFAEHLYRDLIGLYRCEVWWDREKMQSRGRTFLHEIRDAIFQCDFLILVVGPHAKESDYVCDEWEHALLYYKTVIPVLRLGDFDLIPERLKNLHGYDFRDNDRFADELQKLARDIQQGPLKLGALLGVPDLPAHYLPRPEDLKIVSNFVLADVNTPTVITSEKQTVTLQGMGGVGKSVIAAALARAGDTRRAFPDGLVWVSIGQKAELRALYEHVGKLLGDSPQNYTSEMMAKASLQKLIADKVCLLLLDDAWQVKDTEPFKDIVAGTRCRLLITTRKQQIGQALAAQEHRVGLLSPAQAHTLLRDWAGHNDPDLVAIARRVEYLPLALKIAGARLRSGLSGVDWLVKYDRVSRMRTIRQASDRGESLEISIELGLNAVFAADGEKLLYYTFGIFQEDMRIPQHVVIRLWTHPPLGLNNFETGEIVDALVDMALVERHQDDHTLTLHDLLHGYTREKLGDRIIATHNDLLAAYNPDGQPWPQLKDDGYLYDYLAYHLHETGRQDELYTLLTASPDWMEVKFAACVGDTSYMADLDLALGDFEAPIPARPPVGHPFPHGVEKGENRSLPPLAGEGPGMGAEGLLTLAQLHAARHAVYARVSRYTDTDLKTLVWLGHTQEALSHVRLLPNPEEKSRGLLAIDKALRARQRPDDALLPEAVEAARSIQNDWDQAGVLGVLARTLAQAERFGEAGEVARGIQDDYWRATALKDLALALAQAGNERSTAVFGEAREVIRSMRESNLREGVHGDLASALVQAGRFGEALEVARGMEWSHDRVKALQDLASALAQAGRFGEALEVARGILWSHERARALRDLTSALAQAGRFDEAGEVARGIQYDYCRAGALAQAGRFDEALEMARGIQDDYWRARALRDLTSALAQAERFGEALEMARGIQDDYLRATALQDLASALAQAGRFGEALEIARGIQRDYERAEALRDLTSALAQTGRFGEALEIARGIQRDDTRTEALQDLASALAQVGNVQAAVVLGEALDAARDIQRGGSDRSWALRGLAFALAQAGRFDEAGEVARSIQRDDERAKALGALAGALAQAGDTRAAAVFGEAENAARSIQRDYMRAEALGALAGALAQAGRFDEAGEVACSIQRDDERAKALGALAGALAQAGRFDEAGEVARSIQRDDERAKALGALAGALAQAGRFDEAGEVARSIQRDDERAKALGALAGALAQAGRFDEAGEVACSIQRDDERAKALGALAGALAQAGDEQSQAVFGEALEMARGIQSDDTRAKALRDLTSALAQTGRFGEAGEVARGIQDDYWRATALKDLALALAQAGDEQSQAVFGEALDAARSNPVGRGGLMQMGIVARALAQVGYYAQAFLILDMHGPDMFVGEVSRWGPHFDRVSPRLGVHVLREVVRVLGWEHPDWRKVYEMLAAGPSAP